jgi:hypothetical protein
VSELELHLERTVVRPGDELSGEVIWDLGEPPADGELLLRWETSGKGDPESAIVGTVSLAELPRIPDPSGAGDGHPYRTGTTARDEVPPLAARDRRRFRFRLPERPYSLSGKLLTITWSVEVVAGDSKKRTVIVLSPSGREMKL